ncbi:hypothetical protein EB835_18390 [Brevibacterium sp. S22]|nr:hypothetical protein EB836_01455 [Brevibacterium sp. S111]TGD27785.1 hypothetical protein EB835_18390 [Brevibacterium sp. S22]
MLSNSDFDHQVIVAPDPREDVEQFEVRVRMRHAEDVARPELVGGTHPRPGMLLAWWLALRVPRRRFARPAPSSALPSTSKRGRLRVYALI